jgi:hypothetical protein
VNNFYTIIINFLGEIKMSENKEENKKVRKLIFPGMKIQMQVLCVVCAIGFPLLLLLLLL